MLATGATDFWITPCTGRKGRPAIEATALPAPASAVEVTLALFETTGTLGIRERHISRTVLERRMEKVETRFGSIRVKLVIPAGRRPPEPEFSDCATAAAEAGVPVRTVLEEARAAARLLESGGTV